MRWVELTDLFNLPSSEMKQIVKYEKQLNAAMAAKRQALLDAAEEENE